MPTTVADISVVLKALNDSSPKTALTEVNAEAKGAWSVLTVAPGESWSLATQSMPIVSLLVLEGHSTLTNEGGRESLGSGHLVLLEADFDHTLTNEEHNPFRALLNSGATSADGDGK